MAGLAVIEDLARWAYRCLPTKNTLTAPDARLVEEAFHVKLTALGNADAAEIGTTHSSPAPNQPVAPEDGFGTRQAKIIASGPIDHRPLALPEPRRLRDKIPPRSVAHPPHHTRHRGPASPPRCPGWYRAPPTCGSDGCGSPPRRRSFSSPMPF